VSWPERSRECACGRNCPGYRIRVKLKGWSRLFSRRGALETPGSCCSSETSKKAQPAKDGVAKPRVLASSATNRLATKDPKTAELPKGQTRGCVR
jgi:hypothetical protein